jgi:hypothetical protein
MSIDGHFNSEGVFIMALPVSFWTASYLDASADRATSTQIAITTLTAGNVAAQAALIATLDAAQIAMLLGTESQSDIDYARIKTGAARPSNVHAQRENKFVVRYHDATTFQKFRVELPCADLSLLPLGSDFLVITAGLPATYVTAFEAVAKSPSDPTHAVVVDSIQFVGRNL